MRTIIEDAAQESRQRRRRTNARSATSTPASWTRPRSKRSAPKPLDAEFAAHRRDQGQEGNCRADRALTSDDRRRRAPYRRRRASGQQGFDQVRRRPRPGRPRPARPRLLPQGRRRQAQGRSATHTASTSRRCSAWPATRTRRPSAKDILALETELAKAQWTKVELRDPIKAYNKVDDRQARRARARLRLEGYLDAAGVDGKVDYVIVSQPSYLTGLRQARREDAAAGAGRPISAGTLLRELRAVPEQGFVDETSRSTAPRCAACRRISRAGSAASRWSNGASARRWASSTSRKYFPPETKARMDAAGGEPARRVQAEHRHARLDEPGDQEGRRRRSSPSSRRRSAIRTSGATTRRSTIEQGRPRRQRHARQRSSSTSATSTSSASRSTAPSGA